MKLFKTIVYLFSGIFAGSSPTVAGTLEEDARTSAEWISQALTASGYNADFSLQSLSEVDRFIDDNVQDGVPLPGGLLDQQLGSRIFALGSYVGETIRRNRGGEWVTDDNDPEGEISIAVQLERGTVFWPVQRVMRRVKNGNEESISAYGAVLTADQ